MTSETTSVRANGRWNDERATAGERPSAPRPTGYWARVFALATAVFGLPTCAIFLPTVKTFVVETFEKLTRVEAVVDEIDPTVVEGRAAPSIGETLAAEFAALEASAANLGPSSIAFAPDFANGLGSVNSSDFAQFNERANVVDSRVAPVGANLPKAPASNGVASANFESFAAAPSNRRKLPGAPNVFNASALPTVGNAPQTADARNVPQRVDASASVRPAAPSVVERRENASAERLAAELTARGVESVRVERWGSRLWRVSGRAAKDGGVAEFREAIDPSPTVAARTLLAQFGEIR